MKAYGRAERKGLTNARRGARSRLLVSLVSVVVFLSVAHAARGSKRIPPPTLKDLRGVWIGGTVGNELEFVRLQLDATGKGILAVSYLPDSPVRAYFVTSVDLEKLEMKCHLSPADSSSEPIFLQGRFYYSHMDLELGGVTVKWKRQLYLRNEETFMKRLKQLGDRVREIP
jgi:hypothetical protein